MKKVLGVFCVLAVVCIVTYLQQPRFIQPRNVGNVLERTAMLGIFAVGAAFVIISGGIDLSIGALVGLTGCIMGVMLKDGAWSPAVVFPMVLALSLAAGLTHGMLITKLKLQPFVVTLAGFLIYRSIGKWMTGDQNQGIPPEVCEPFLHRVPVPFLPGYAVPVSFLMVIALAVAAAVFLNLTVYGRYLLAVGRNEQAARFSGINTDRVTITAYVLCSGLAGFGAILYATFLPSIQPASHGEFLELSAIAAAVLGGCSLRGGEGNILGVLLGSALITVLYNSAVLLGIPRELEFAIVGTVILIGAILDESVKRLAAERRRRSGAP